MFKKLIFIVVALFLTCGFLSDADINEIVNSEPITEISLLDVASLDIDHNVEYFDTATNKLVSLKTADDEHYLTITDDLQYDAAKITKQQYYIVYIMMADNNVTPIKIVDGKLEIRQSSDTKQTSTISIVFSSLLGFAIEKIFKMLKKLFDMLQIETTIKITKPKKDK